MDHRPLGRTGLTVSLVGFGAFKIGRNEGIKYAAAYPLPDEDEAGRLLHGVLDLGITLIDTAPAYGLSEERIGRHLGGRRDEFVLSTKVGETFADGRSTYDFTGPAVRAGLERSLRRLATEVIDLVLVHSDGRDRVILDETDTVPALLAAREAGLVRAIGFSGKTVDGARAALAWADAIMVEYHVDDPSHRAVIDEAAAAGVGVLVKKGLASGRLPAAEAIRFALAPAGVSSVVVGSLNLDHLAANLRAAGTASSG